MALDFVLSGERRDQLELEEERFKSRMIAAHPERAKDIIEMFENAAKGIGADGMERYEVPQEAKGALTTEDISSAVRELAQFGISLRPVEL